MPAFLTLVPGTLLLVPGSFGFRSVSLFLGADVESGIDAALRMLLIAMAITAGLLVAQALVRCGGLCRAELAPLRRPL